MLTFNLTRLLENSPSTNIHTGNPNNDPRLRSPLEDLFDEEDEKFEDNLFSERKFMSQQEFDEDVTHRVDPYYL